MEMKILIGDVAKYHNISKQTLIHYDRIGLLKPSIVEGNSYRYYTFEDIDKLDLIICLKEAGLSLKEIKAYMVQPSLDESMVLLENQSKKLDKTIEKLLQVQSRINNKISEIKHIKTIDLSKDIREIKKPERVILKYEIIRDENEKDNFLATLKVFRDFIHNHPIYDPYSHYIEGVVISKKDLEARSMSNLDSVFIFIDTPAGGENEVVLDECLYICKQHYGSFSGLDTTYDDLLDYIEEAGYELAGDAIEIPIITTWSVSSENDYVTDVQIPVKKIRT
ncbi:MerR family transcriptional regulator [Acidaminobacter sp. JC074]|uniref:MerR family transcriptional regulator n=1 Tax=Acidaminobacter sp. JC074 TaxID=2530199 RepID=UPI001F0E27DF|nr:MerR family transcriptional regulator [Acidaminobacter sp. JC074]